MGEALSAVQEDLVLGGCSAPWLANGSAAGILLEVPVLAGLGCGGPASGVGVLALVVIDWSAVAVAPNAAAAPGGGGLRGGW